MPPARTEANSHGKVTGLDDRPDVAPSARMMLLLLGSSPENYVF